MLFHYWESFYENSEEEEFCMILGIPLDAQVIEIVDSNYKSSQDDKPPLSVCELVMVEAS